MIGATDQWHFWLPQIQWSLNQITQSQTGSMFFEIVHARPFNNFLDFSNAIVHPDTESNIDKRVKLISNLYSTIYFAIVKHVLLMRANRNESFNTSKAVQLPLVLGTRVMTLIKLVPASEILYMRVISQSNNLHIVILCSERCHW